MKGKTKTEESWDDLLGTGTVLKQVIDPGRRPQEEDEEISMEAPRKFFALIDIETLYEGNMVKGESHENFLINCDADLFAGAHLVIPLMDLDEKSRYIFDPKFVYGPLGNAESGIPANAKLECIITLKFRAHYDDFLADLNTHERIFLAKRKNERGKFWFKREDYHNAISIYQTITDLCVPSNVSTDGDAF